VTAGELVRSTMLSQTSFRRYVTALCSVSTEWMLTASHRCGFMSASQLALITAGCVAALRRSTKYAGNGY